MNKFTQHTDAGSPAVAVPIDQFLSNNIFNMPTDDKMKTLKFAKQEIQKNKEQNATQEFKNALKTFNKTTAQKLAL